MRAAFSPLRMVRRRAIRLQKVPMKIIRKSISMQPVVAAKLALLARRRECPESQILAGLTLLEWSKELHRNPIRPDESAALRSYTSGECSRSSYKALLARCSKISCLDSTTQQSIFSNMDSDSSTLEHAKKRKASKRQKTRGPKPKSRADKHSATQQKGPSNCTPGANTLSKPNKDKTS
jgi:hypothetical protein